MFVLDGGFGFGPPAMMQAIAIATERARTLGVGFGLVRETTHTGAVGRYVQWMAEQGCAALIMVSGPAFVAYHGARVASMGTSPIAIAVPQRQRPDRSRHGDQHDFERHDHPGARQRHRTAGGRRADGGWRADNRPASRGHPAAARRTQGIGTRADVRDAGERARRRADPGARARTGEAQTAHAELRDPRHRCRGVPAACGFYPRRRYAGRDPSKRCRGRRASTKSFFRASARAAPKPSAASPVFQFRQSFGRSWCRLPKEARSSFRRSFSPVAFVPLTRKAGHEILPVPLRQRLRCFVGDSLFNSPLDVRRLALKAHKSLAPCSCASCRTRRSRDAGAKKHESSVDAHILEFRRFHQSR